MASKKLRSLEIKCKNYSIDPIDGCLKYFDPFAEDGTNYLFVVPMSLRGQFLHAHHNAHFQGVIVAVILLSAFFVRNTTGQVWSKMSVNGSRNV